MGFCAHYAKLAVVRFAVEMRLCPQCTSPCDSTHKFCAKCGFPIGQIPEQSADTWIGRTLPGGFCILELVGVGGMGRVYRAEQTTLGRTVAVKIIHPHLVGDESAAARFITEARAASRLNHPNSVSIIDFGKTDDGQLYLVMEFLRGRDLARVMFDEGPLPLRRVVDITRQTLAALAEAHHLEIIHRDLKPENIILEPVRSGGDFVKVVDFGLAKMRFEQTNSRSITSPGIVCGTPEYMSPEQGRGDPLDPRSDLYAVGVILFQLLTGRVPFEGDTPTQVVLAHITETPPDPRQVARERDIPTSLAEATLKALSKEASKRFSNANEFFDFLGDAFAEEDRASLRGRSLALRCSACGVVNAPGQKFCGECGSALVTIQSTLPPPRSFDEQLESEVGLTRLPPARPLVLRSSIPKLPLALLGREDELGWLEERRAEAAAHLVVARLVGDIGVGKTRLMEDFLLVAGAAGDTIVRAGPDSYCAEVGYHAVSRVIKTLINDDVAGATSKRDLPPDVRMGLNELFARTRVRVSQFDIDPTERRARVAAAFRWSLREASARARGRRIVIAIDDLHHVDGASRNALLDVVRDPPAIPVLMLVTHSPEFDGGWREEWNDVRVLLGLSAATLAELFSNGVPSAAARFDGAGQIPPLYVDQLVHFTQEHGGGAPNRLADLMALRIERLSAECRRVLQAVAVWGEVADVNIVLTLLPDETGWGRAVDHLSNVGMVRREGSAVRFTHPLLRDVALATIPAAVRRGLHSAAADICRDRHEPVEACAQHEYFAGNSFQALILLERMSSESEGRDDIDGSVFALRRALDVARKELFRGELDDPARAVVLFSRKLGEALVRSGHFADAEGVLREALDLSAAGGSDRARLLGALARVAYARERVIDARSYLHEALDLAARSGAFELVQSLEPLRRAMA